MALVNIDDKDLGALDSAKIKYKTTDKKSSKDTPYSFKGVEFPKLEAAPYNFLDPQKYAETFGDFNRTGFGENFQDSQGYALKTLDTELKGLQGFVPAAAALKRSTTSADNIFNQQQREDQINKVLPGAKKEFADQRGILQKQGQRAAAYSEGRLPDALLDRSLELGVRSRAADIAGFSGIGPRSSQSNKISDLMSADQRFQIAQYGENLVNQNINARDQNISAEGSVFLAPTEYSNAGSSVNVAPEVGAGQLGRAFTSDLNQQTLINPTDALNTDVNQQQFKTNLNERVNEFNVNTQMTIAGQKLGAKLGGGGGGGGGGGVSNQVAFDRDFQILAEGYKSGQTMATQAGQDSASGTKAWVGFAPEIVNFGKDVYNSVVGDSDE